MKTETIISILLLIFVLFLIILSSIIILGQMRTLSKEGETVCQRVSMNEYEDNCMCPCNEKLTWIDRKLNIKDTCDGWIVKKGEPCINSLT